MKRKTVSFKVCRCASKWQCKCLFPREKKPHPPFNSNVSLGSIIGYHPKLMPTGGDSPDVGLYDPRSIRAARQVARWDTELKTESRSGKHEIKNKFLKSGQGPGAHEITRWPESILYQRCKSICEDIGFGIVPFSKTLHRSTTPGPGYTSKDPYYHLEEGRKKRASCIPSFEYDGLQPRFRERQKSWILPCTLYNVKHPCSLESFLQKKTGKRGPYDLFTGPRDESTLKSYLAGRKREDCGEWPKALASELDKILHKSNYFKGRWSKCPRFTKKPTMRLMLTDICLSYKDPDEPGPGYYQPKSPRKPKNRFDYPFDTSIEHARPEPRAEIRPGPARYKIKEKYVIPGKGWSCNFKSKVVRRAFLPPPTYNSF